MRKSVYTQSNMTIFEWDENKAESNLQKHKVSFEEARTIFDDEFLITFLDELHSIDEQRFISIGYSKTNRILLAVHLQHSKNIDDILIRIISCRKATALEREIYEKQE